jgi:hypothetical protein
VNLRYAICFMIFTARFSLAQVLPNGPLPEASGSQIGYRTVAEALTSLKDRKDVTLSIVREWTIIVDEKNLTVWSFAPASYIAYPAVVKRTARARVGGGSDLEIKVLCEATKDACDQLVREFAQMNLRIP